MSKYRELKKKLLSIANEMDKEQRHILVNEFISHIKHYKQHFFISEENYIINPTELDVLIHSHMCHELAQAIVKDIKMSYENDCFSGKYTLDILVLL